MYGGLFGDLPAAKKSAQDEYDKESGEKQQPETSKNVKASQQTKPRVVASAAQPKSLTTPTAFVPAAARARRKPVIKAAVIKKEPIVSSSVSSSMATQPIKQEQNNHPQLASGILPKVETIVVSQGLAQSQPVDIHNVHQNGPTIKMENNTFHNPPEASARQQQTQYPPESFREVTNHQVVESDDMRRLHEKALEDPYDPMVPNDLLQYWERQCFEKERQALELERQQAFEHQERIRAQLQQERQELAQAGQIEQLAGRAMGRGRGVSNLPAWLVEQQKRQVGALKQEPPSQELSQPPFKKPKM